MNQLHPLFEVTELIYKMRSVTSGTFYLYAINKQLALHHGPELPRYSTVITTLESKEINEGLPTWRWQCIEDKIRILRKRGILCPQPQKH